MMMKKRFSLTGPWLTACLIAGTITSCFAQEKTYRTQQLTFRTETIETGIQVPWGMAFMPNGDILVTDVSGKIRIVRNNKILPDTIKGVPQVFHRGQGGLFYIELHPDYNNNGWLYISYAALDKAGGITYIMRAKLRDNTLTNQEILFKGAPFTRASEHFGGRLQFGKDGYLYFTIGERGQKEKAQLLETVNGKVYRIKDDGSIPEDNPFINTPHVFSKAIYSYGHRNPQGLTLNPWTHEIWETEHGPMGGDELNIIEKGKNYGWPAITYGVDYDGSIISKDTVKEGMEQPIYFWRPSIGTSNLIFVNSDKYPSWNKQILVCSLRNQHIERLELTNNKVTYRERFFGDYGRIRNIDQGPDGYIYVATEGGKLIKFIPVK